MQTNSDEGLRPSVIWGEHRTSEPLALDIKDQLLSDPNITSRIIFHEHEKYKISDYTERLFRQQEAKGAGKTQEQIADMLRGFRTEVKEYDKEQRKMLGELVFNLHDGYQRAGAEHDIEFWIPPRIKDEEILVQYLESLAMEHNIKLKIRRFQKEGFIRPPESIIVEFMTPNADTISSFPSEAVEKLAKEFDPMDAGARNFIDYKLPNREDISYKETVKKYVAFMKDVLMGLEHVRIE